MTQPERRLLGGELQVINIGLQLFADTLERYHVPVVHLEWQPPAGGDARLIDLLRQLGVGQHRPPEKE